MKLNYHEHFCPAHDVVFSIMFGERDLFRSLVSAVTDENIILDGEPHSQATLHGRSSHLRTIRFDVFAWTQDKKLYTADMERTCKGVRLKRRATYYACRALSSQKVKKMAYENINPISISFILTEHGKEDKRKKKQKNPPTEKERAVRRVQLCYLDTHEVYDNILDIVLVSIPIAVRVADKNSDLHIIARFFAVTSQTEASKFVGDYGHTDLGRELIMKYNETVLDPDTLEEIEDSDYFTTRLTEVEIEEERQRVVFEAMTEVAMGLLGDGMSPEIVAKHCKLDLDYVLSLK